jgi:hypothetical protein
MPPLSSPPFFSHPDRSTFGGRAFCGGLPEPLFSRLFQISIFSAGRTLRYFAKSLFPFRLLLFRPKKRFTYGKILPAERPPENRLWPP